MNSFTKFLLDEGVLRFGDFTLKSGRKCPYFMNFGDIKNGGSITMLAAYYGEIIKGLDLEGRILFGPAYKGIPLVVATSVILKEKYNISLPFAYNRKEAKDHGEGGSIVGTIPKEGDRITIVEDVITAGTAVKESLEILKPTGAVVDSLVVAVDRMERGKGERSATKELEEEYGIKVYSISSIEEVAENLTGENGAYKDKIWDYLKEYGGKR